MCDIGKRIKDRRIELGLSAEDLAELVGLSAATIYRYENGDIRKVNTTKLQAFANALKTTEAYLMGWVTTNEELAEERDDDIWEYREAVRRNPEMRILFDAAKGATSKQLKQAVAILEALKASEGNA